MGTRSRIGVMHGDKVKSVYCHWDGYLSHNGVILQEHYNGARANELVSLGDLSALRPDIGDKHVFSRLDSDLPEAEYEALYGNMCTFYGRDRGEKNCEWQVAHTFAEFMEQVDLCGAEYYYIMRDGEWYVGTSYDNMHPMSKSLIRLSEALKDEEVTV